MRVSISFARYCFSITHLICFVITIVRQITQKEANAERAEEERREAKRSRHRTVVNHRAHTQSPMGSDNRLFTFLIPHSAFAIPQCFPYLISSHSSIDNRSSTIKKSLPSQRTKGLLPRYHLTSPGLHRSALHPGHHPGFAVTGSPAPVYSRDAVSSAILPGDFGPGRPRRFTPVPPSLTVRRSAYSSQPVVY